MGEMGLEREKKTVVVHIIHTVGIILRRHHPPEHLRHVDNLRPEVVLEHRNMREDHVREQFSRLVESRAALRALPVAARTGAHLLRDVLERPRLREDAQLRALLERGRHRLGEAYVGAYELDHLQDEKRVKKQVERTDWGDVWERLGCGMWGETWGARLHLLVGGDAHGLEEDDDWDVVGEGVVP